MCSDEVDKSESMSCLVSMAQSFFFFIPLIVLFFFSTHFDAFLYLGNDLSFVVHNETQVLITATLFVGEE